MNFSAHFFFPSFYWWCVGFQVLLEMSFLEKKFTINSTNVEYCANGDIISKYIYSNTIVDDCGVVTPVQEELMFKTVGKVPKLGLMLVGWGGNNGSTITAGIIANQLGLKWDTKEGEVKANYFGSLTQASTIRLGVNKHGDPVYIPFKNILPMVNPNDIVVGGWDISKLNLADCMKRAKVLDINLQQQVYPLMKDFVPLPTIYQENFIAANQSSRADNLLEGSKQEKLDAIRGHIRDFKRDNELDKVIVLWTANTERFCAVEEDINDTADSLLAAIQV